MKNVNQLSKAEMKNVTGGGDICYMSVTYDNGSVGSDNYYIGGGSSGANDLCVAWITGSSYGVSSCRYDCLSDGIGQ
ncbi:hypothetical protein [Pedobacter metabolipauper]|uniref:Uncharacterized protein n=1 Tax=Pedobacter metabolipauper TaxID=425513 RepID=A0A4R6SYT2_9SPHI|nr:hypothetical protein [Pedobacter metabolipauper]TDQ11764.1 hypothetical protein ATK78_0892 [Pedobacter metabolipauper]